MTTSLTSPPTSPSALDAALGQTHQAQTPTRRIGLWIGLAVVVCALAAGVGWMTLSRLSAAAVIANVDRYVVEPRDFAVVLKEKGELKASNSTEIVSEVEGRSTIISLVPEGTAVQKGDLLVELASDQIEDRIRQEELKEANAITAYEAAKTELEIRRDRNASDIRKADLRIELARLALDKYQKGQWQQRLKDATIRIEQAQISLKREKEDFEAAKKLIEKNFITQTEYNDDEFNHKKAEWELDKARQAKVVLEQYTHVADLRQRESDLEEAQKERGRVKKNADAEELKKVRAVEGKEKELELIQDQLAKLRRQMEKSRIYAPTQGFVVYFSGRGGRHFMSNDNQIREGASVFERQVLMTLPDTSEMLVVVRVHEAKTDKLQIGQRARVRVEGIPDHEFTGTVTKIAVVADSQNRWLNPDLKEYETEIKLDHADVPLKPGVTAHAEILVETVESKLAIPVQAVYSKTGQRYAFSVTAEDVTATEIQLGAIGAEWAEVADGLARGDEILLAFGDEHKRLIPDLPVDQQANGNQWNGKGSAPRPSSGDDERQSKRVQPAGDVRHQGTQERRTQDAQRAEVRVQPSVTDQRQDQGESASSGTKSPSYAPGDLTRRSGAPSSIREGAHP